MEYLNFVWGVFILIIGWFLGEILSKNTAEELQNGQRWFKVIIGISLMGALISLFFVNDILLFTFLFIAIVVSRSIKKKKGGKKA